MLNTLYEPIIGKLCPANAACADRLGFSDESSNDIADTWRRINDDIQYVFDNFTDQIPLFLSKELYMKVCLRVFEDGDINWGRMVALFYFAYRLNIRALAKGLDNIPWVQQVLTWTGDFLFRYIAPWVCSRGGWKMIKEWIGPSNKTWVMLCATSIALGLWFYFKKN